MVTTYTPTSRWRGRLHRQSDRTYLITRPTFDILRANSEGTALEDKAFDALRNAISNDSGNGVWRPVAHVQETPRGARQVQAALNYSLEIEGSEELKLGLLAIIGDSQLDFPGEGMRGPVILHFLCQRNDGDWKSRIPTDDFGPELATLEEVFDHWSENPETAESPLIAEALNPIDFDTRLYKIMPTDLISQGDRRSTMRFIRSETAEVRLSDDVNSPSREQSKLLNLIRLGNSPALNTTGRPGSGKTTVAFSAAAEVALQHGPKRGDRKILLVTTTGPLANLAWREVEVLVNHVYDEKSSGKLFERIKKNLYIESRDSLIKDSPREDQRLDQEVLESLIDEVRKGSRASPSFDEALLGPMAEEDLKSLKEMLREPSEIRRAVLNLVFGVFGSIRKFTDWIDSLRAQSTTPGGFHEAFFKKPINFISGLPEEKSDNSHAFILSDFWDPFRGLEASDPDYLERGRSRITALYNFLTNDLLGGLLHNSEGQGHWSHASVMDSINDSYQSRTGIFSEEGQKKLLGRREGKKPIWDLENINDFDCIIIDESQDFTPKEISVLLQRFSNRGESENGLRNSQNGSPFLFYACGDPLQIVEGSLFNPRNQHIQATHTDWFNGLRDSASRENLISGLSPVTHSDLTSNYRNSAPVVDAINNIIEEMKSLSKDLGLKRSIDKQSAAGARKGTLVRFCDPDGDVKADNSQSMNQDLLVRDVVEQINRAAETKTSQIPDPSVALILPLESLDDEDSILECIPDEMSEIRESIEHLFSRTHYRAIKKRNDQQSLLRLKMGAGINTVSSIKGLTFTGAIVVGFDKRIREAKGDRLERLRRLAHYLVAISRPQFVLLFHEHEPLVKKGGAPLLEENVDLEVDLLKSLLSRRNVDLNPAFFFDDCMSFPGEQRFWDLFDWSIETLEARDRNRSEDGKHISNWDDVRALKDWCYAIHERHSEGDFDAAIYELMADETDLLPRIRNGAKIIDRESFCSQRSIDELRKYLAWRDFLLHGKRMYDEEDSKDLLFLKQDPNLEKWISIEGSGFLDDGNWSKIIPDDLGGSLTPFEWFVDNDGEPAIPSWDQSNVVLSIPEGWIFPSGEHRMEHTSSWSTPVKLLEGVLSREGTPKTSEIKTGSTDEGSLINYLRIKWFLQASRSPHGLLEIISQANHYQVTGREFMTEFMPISQSIQWIMDCLSDSVSSSRIRRAMLSWSRSSSDRDRLNDFIANWIMTAEDPSEMVGRVTKLVEIFGSSEKRLLRQFFESFCTSGDSEEALAFIILSNKKEGLESTATLVKEYCGVITSHLTDQKAPKTLKIMREFTSACLGQRPTTVTKHFREDTPAVASNATLMGFWMALMTAQIRIDAMVEEIQKEWFNTNIDQKIKQSQIVIMHHITNILRDEPEQQGWKKDEFVDSLRRATRETTRRFMRQLYNHCVDTGEPVSKRYNPGLRFLLELHFGASSSDETLEMLLGFEDVKTDLTTDGHNFWHSQAGDMEGQMERRGMTIHYPHLLQGLRDPVISRYSTIPYPTEKKPAFSSSLPGLIAYLSVRQDMGYEELREMRDRFRRAGAYREAALTGLASAATQARDASIGDRDQIIRTAMREALLERPGIFYDHATNEYRWADYGMIRARPPQNSPTRKKWGNPTKDFLKCFSMRFDDSSMSIVNRIDAPLLPRVNGKTRSFNWLDPDGPSDLLMSYFESPPSTKKETAMGVTEDYDGEIHQSIRSVEDLLPYLFFSQEVSWGVDLSSATWFRRVPELEKLGGISGYVAAQEVLAELEGNLVPSAEGLLKEHTREELINSMKENGDSWLYNLSRELSGKPEWSDERLQRFSSRIISMTSPSPLRNMAAILLGDGDEAISEATGSTDNVRETFDNLSPSQREEMRRLLREDEEKDQN